MWLVLKRFKFLPAQLVANTHTKKKNFDLWALWRLTVRAQVSHVGFVVDKVTLRQAFSEYFGFSCQSFHRLLHAHRYPSSGAGTVGQTGADVTSELSVIPTQETLSLEMINDLFLQ
jgi:hypothetical protein